jgi:hypothetical protein
VGGGDVKAITSTASAVKKKGKYPKLSILIENRYFMKSVSVCHVRLSIGRFSGRTKLQQIFSQTDLDFARSGDNFTKLVRKSRLGLLKLG